MKPMSAVAMASPDSENKLDQDQTEDSERQVSSFQLEDDKKETSENIEKKTSKFSKCCLYVGVSFVTIVLLTVIGSYTFAASKD
jgi:hypothetical protein